jgi:flagellar hook-associated protein 3 FlgL
MTQLPAMNAAGFAPGLLGQLVAEAGSTRARLDRLTAQAGSGSLAGDYAGLGNGARISLDLRPDMVALTVTQTNIAAASARNGTALNALERVSAIASDFYARINSLNGLTTTDVDTTAAAARGALRELAGLLDTKDGDTYVFAGQDSANPPVPDPDNILSSGFYTQIATSVGGLAVAGAAATSAATLAIAASNAPGTSPFSIFLSQPAAALRTQRATVQVGEQRYEPVGLLAGTNAAATSTGTSTTGSYIRDIMRALATLGSLSSPQISAPGFSALVDDTRTSLRDAISAISTDSGILGDEQKRLAAEKDQSAHTLVSLTAQVSNVEDVDMAATLSSLSQAQTQLQASYQMIASFSQFTLVRFLG